MKSHALSSESYPLIISFAALLCAFFVIAFAAVFSTVTNLSHDVSLFVVNAAFLFLIIAGGISFFGHEMVQSMKPYAAALYMKSKGRQRVFLEAPPGMEKETARDRQIIGSATSTAYFNCKEDVIGTEIAMMAILAKAADSREREMICHKQICHWRAMLALLTEDMIDGTGAHSGCKIENVPVKVAPMITL